MVLLYHRSILSSHKEPTFSNALTVEAAVLGITIQAPRDNSRMVGNPYLGITSEVARHTARIRLVELLMPLPHISVTD